MKRRRSVLLLLLVGVVAVVLPIPRAFACSCVQIPTEEAALRSLITESDGAVVGTVVGIDNSAPDDVRITTLRIESATENVRGKTIEISSSKQDSACGLGTPVGRRIALLLHGKADRWGSSVCSRAQPTALSNAIMAAGQPGVPAAQPPPSGVEVIPADWSTKLWAAIPALLALGLVVWAIVRFSRRSRA